MRLTYKAVREAALTQGRTVAEAAAYLQIPEDAFCSAQHDVTYGHRQAAEAILSGHWAPPEPRARLAASAKRETGPASLAVSPILHGVEQQPLTRLKTQQGAPDGNDEATSRLKHFAPSAAPGRPPVEAGANDAAGSASDTNVELNAFLSGTVPSDDRPDGGEYKPSDSLTTESGTASLPATPAASEGPEAPSEPIGNITEADVTAHVGECEPHNNNGASVTKEIGERAQSLFRRASDVRPEPVEWLWPRLIPVGALTIASGNPNVGKSLYSAFVAAAVTTGAAWPDGSGNAPSGEVLVLAAEDDHGTTVVPRLRAAGAALDRIILPPSAAIHLPLPELVRQVVNERPKLKAVAIDVLADFVEGKDLSRNDKMRPLMQELQTVAREAKLAILALTHTNKRGGVGIGQLAGAGSIYAVARSVLQLQAHPHVPGQFVVVQVKGNLGPADSLTYRIEQAQTETGDGGQIETAKLSFVSDALPVTLADLEGASRGAEPTVLRAAIAFLNVELAAGPLAATELSERAKAAGITTGTLRRAKDAVTVAKKTGMDGGWVVELKTSKMLSQPEDEHAHEHEHLRHD